MRQLSQQATETNTQLSNVVQIVNSLAQQHQAILTTINEMGVILDNKNDVVMDKLDQMETNTNAQIAGQNDTIKELIANLVGLREYLDALAGDNQQLNLKFDTIMQTIVNLQQGQVELQERLTSNIAEVATSFAVNTPNFWSPVGSPRTNAVCNAILSGGNTPTGMITPKVAGVRTPTNRGGGKTVVYHTQQQLAELSMDALKNERRRANDRKKVAQEKGHNDKYQQEQAYQDLVQPEITRRR